MSFDSNGNYNKTNWKNGDIITADKLNKIEESLEIINNNDTSRHEETDARLNALEDSRIADKQEINTINTNIDNMNTNINNSLNTKVDKINGKGLSTNDYTTNEKNKLSGIENNANNYVHPATHNVSMIDGLSTVIDENLNPVKDEISNLNKELDKIKKIEETTVSTIVTENKITSVEETNNGYFNQIKLEGKTLVNVVNKPKNGIMTIEQNLGNGNLVNTTENSLITPSVKGKTIVNLLSSNPTINHASINTVYLENNYIIHDLQGSSGNVNFKFKYIEPSTQYTVCYNVVSLTNGLRLHADLFPDTYDNLNSHTATGLKCYTFTTPEDLSTLECFRLYFDNDSYGSCKVSFPMIFEGDLTKTPELIPTEYVEGLKSSFEDTHISLDDLEHPNKYKVEYKTVGKNKFPMNLIMGHWRSSDLEYSTEYPDTCTTKTPIRLKPHTEYTLSRLDVKAEGNIYIVDIFQGYKSENRILLRDKNTYTFNSDNSDSIYIQVNTEGEYAGNFDFYNKNIQLEEGVTATTYEPYKENIQTLYLNSPLLEGDEIKVVDGKLGHYHNMGKAVLNGNENWHVESNSNADLSAFRAENVLTNARYYRLVLCDTLSSQIVDWNSKPTIFANDMNGVAVVVESSIINSVEGFKQWLQQNPTTVVYELANPYFEPLTEDIPFIQSFKNGHLQIDTIVPVIDVKTEPLYIYPHYLNASTEYLVQFYADRQGDVNITLDTAQESIQVQSGINKIYLTTSSNVNPILKLSGNNIKIKDIMIVEKTDNEVEYFEGIKSVGDGTEEISLVTHKNPIRFGKGGRI